MHLGSSCPLSLCFPPFSWSQLISSCPSYFGITNTLLVLSEVSDIKVVTTKTGSEPQGTADSDLSPFQLRFRSLPGTSSHSSRDGCKSQLPRHSWFSVLQSFPWGDSALLPLGACEAPGRLPVLLGQLPLCLLSSDAVEQHKLEKSTVYIFLSEFIHALKKSCLFKVMLS